MWEVFVVNLTDYKNADTTSVGQCWTAISENTTLWRWITNIYPDVGTESCTSGRQWSNPVWILLVLFEIKQFRWAQVCCNCTKRLCLRYPMCWSYWGGVSSRGRPLISTNVTGRTLHFNMILSFHRLSHEFLIIYLTLLFHLFSWCLLVCSHGFYRSRSRPFAFFFNCLIHFDSFPRGNVSINSI